ncbi:uncharacterized protein B0H18DRAFT_122441 [Fomitopsis serialis]|uniref:uncharacterized protein n=1 Tax=Fomitopsis serialis TaxID=139415 RepID=UPI0020085D7C|nr:uncharacterized protein B0H18DRAFT_122441 [Neoantrodia serialis]KAH9914740.1 hypothetical protein B0H18DRAFT_122441 [Neoantrodia serialis]
MAPDSLVLVTGINGHIASATAVRLLEQGYRVRGTIRSLSRTTFLRNAFAHYGGHFEIVEVADITAEHAFDDAMKGVDVVIHVASPVHMDAKSPDEHNIPAVQGSLGILRSARAEPSVTHFCYMSSIVTLIATAKDPKTEVITPDDWNVKSEEWAHTLEPSHPRKAFHIYCGSKVRADKACWEYIQTHKPNFTFTTVLPGPTFGPIHNPVTRPPGGDTSLGQVYDFIAVPPRIKDASTVVNFPFVHVYDVADLCVQSITNPDAHGKRLVAVHEKVAFAEIGDILRKAYPDRPVPPGTVDGACLDYPDREVIRWDTSLSTEVLGGKWRSLEDAIMSCAADLAEKEKGGWDIE